MNMKLSVKNGKCIECGSNTNIQLDCGKYACINCLNRIGKETKNVREYIETFADIFNNDFMFHFLELLNVMKFNNITSVDSIVSTLSAIQLHNEYKNGTISAENKKKIEKQLDIFDIL